MKTGFLSHELYMWHNTGSAALFEPTGLYVEPDEHVESPKTKRRFRNLMEVSGLLDKMVLLRPTAATLEDVTRFHTPEYVEKIKTLSRETGGDAGEMTPFGPGSYEIALLSAGGVITAAEAVWSGDVENAYALVRPPGHHADADNGRGFCIFGNIVIAIKKMQQIHGVKKIAVVDWDVHHGNGTQTAFYDKDDVLTISVHQDRCYPHDSGFVTETGEGKGKGHSINVPLPPGSGIGAYEQTFRQIVQPALDRFSPDMIFIASGYDAGAVDPLGRMMMHSEGYRTLTKMMMESANQLCEGKLVIVHEGGYSASNVPFCGLAVMEQLSKETTGIEDPLLEFMQNIGQQELQPHQAAAIDIAASVAGL